MAKNKNNKDSDVFQLIDFDDFSKVADNNDDFPADEMDEISPAVKDTDAADSDADAAGSDMDDAGSEVDDAGSDMDDAGSEVDNAGSDVENTDSVSETDEADHTGTDPESGFGADADINPEEEEAENKLSRKEMKAAEKAAKAEAKAAEKAAKAEAKAANKAAGKKHPVLRVIGQICGGLLCMAVGAAGAVAFILFYHGGMIVKSVTLEAGQSIGASDFMDAEILNDASEYDTSVPGTYNLTLRLREVNYPVTLVVQDTLAPTGEAVPTTVDRGVTPDPANLVTNISDATDVTISYAEEPDVNTGGTVDAQVRLTDTSGNYTDIAVPLTVVVDDQAPVIDGTEDLSVFIGDTVTYKKNVTVTDNIDQDPQLTIDNSAVDLTKEGEYPVIYTATDAAGNSSSVTITLTVSEKPADYADQQEVLAMAQDICNEILDDSMDEMQKAFAIYKWVQKNISYRDTSDKTSWAKGAYDGFTKGVGDCFTYYSASKALLTAAGIQNLDIEKSDTHYSHHYWNLINIGTGWYHFDTTPRSGTGDNFFMVTDAELEAYSTKHNNSHIFDSSLYPERATQSVQYMVDYTKKELNENASQ